MNQPSIIVRAAGTPGVAIALTFGGVWLIFMWTQGRASVGLALAGCFAVVRTLSAAKHLRRYKAWRKQLEAVGNVGKAPPRRMIPSRRLATVLALTLLLG